MKKTQKGDTMILSDFFQQHPQAAIGFSGGVDSAYLAYCAKKYAQNMLAKVNFSRNLNLRMRNVSVRSMKFL